MRHVVEDLGSICPYVQILDLPVLRLVEQPVEVDSFFRNFVPAVAEQVIEVPKLALPVGAVERAALPEPQLVEQLVEVPTVLSVAVLQQRTAEQIVGFSVPGLGGGACGGLQGLSLGQGSAAVSGSVNVSTPVPHGRGEGARGGLQGLSLGQGSTVVCGAGSVVSPVPHGRGEGARGGLHGLSQGQGSTAVCEAEHANIPVPFGRGGLGDGGLQSFSQEQGSTAFYGAAHDVSPVPHGRGWSRGVVQGFLPSQGPAALSEQGSAPAVHAAPAPVGEFMASAPSVHAAPVSSGYDASRVEQDIDVEGVDYLGRVVYHTGTCVMLDMEDFKWRSLGEGTFRLLRSSEGAKNVHFQFWRRRQLLVDDVISGLVLRGSSKGLSWRWRNPEFQDGPNDYRHAVRFQSAGPGSQVL